MDTEGGARCGRGAGHCEGRRSTLLAQVLVVELSGCAYRVVRAYRQQVVVVGQQTIGTAGEARGEHDVVAAVA